MNTRIDHEANRKWYCTALKSLIAVVVALTLCSHPPDASAAGGTDKLWPKAEELQIGDLLFPRGRGKLVLFSSNDATIKTEEEHWIRNRNRFVAELRKKSSNLSNDELSWGHRLSEMTFQEFQYQFDGRDGLHETDDFGAESYLPVYVGHVAIVSIERAGPMIIEAVPDRVRKVPYQRWIETYVQPNNMMVWQYRFGKDVFSNDMRHRIADAASEYAVRGTTYGIAPAILSKLDDESSMYCTKLVWLSVFKATAFRLGGTDDNLVTWFTPNDLLCQRNHLQAVFRPGEREYSVFGCLLGRKF